jgi:hypothetical protein
MTGTCVGVLGTHGTITEPGVFGTKGTAGTVGT